MNGILGKRCVFDDGQFEEVIGAVRVMVTAVNTSGGVLCRPRRRGHVAARQVPGRERPPFAARCLTPRPDSGVAHAPVSGPLCPERSVNRAGPPSGMRGVDVSVAVLSEAACRHVFNEVSLFPEGNTYAAD